MAVVALSIFLMIFDPHLAFNIDGRGARGVFLHKNGFAEFLLVTIAAVMVAIRMQLLPRPIGIALLLIHMMLLLMANSATAWGAAVLVIGVYVLIEMRRLPFKIFAALLAFSTAFTILVVSLIVFNLDSLFSAIDRDPTLTGRDAIWAYAGRMIQERFFFGYGYAAFWESKPVLSYIEATLNWQITHAHNGFLQIWIELGLVGFCLMVLYLVLSLLRFFLAKPSKELQAFVLPTTIGLIGYNLAETQLLLSKNLGWTVTLICLLLTTPNLAEIRARFSRQSPMLKQQSGLHEDDAATSSHDRLTNAHPLTKDRGDPEPRSV
jgi:O-antigen ligase